MLVSDLLDQQTSFRLPGNDHVSVFIASLQESFTLGKIEAGLAKLASVTVKALGLQGRSDLVEEVIWAGRIPAAGFIRKRDIVVGVAVAVGNAQIDPEADEGRGLCRQLFFLRRHRRLLGVSDYPVEKAIFAATGHHGGTVVATF